MIQKLKHPCIQKYKDVLPVSSVLLNVINSNEKDSFTINKFCETIKNIAQSNLTWNRKSDNSYYSFSGNVFEVFVEYLIKTNEGNREIGIYNYEPIENDDDYGVDGVGISIINQLPVTVQIKYRSKESSYLTAKEDKISNFYSKSLSTYFNKYPICDIKPYNLLVITSGCGIHYESKSKMFNNMIKDINRSKLRSMVDGCVGFWVNFYESVLLTENDNY